MQHTVFNPLIGPSSGAPFPAKLVSNVRVTARDHFQDVRLVTFDIAESGMRQVSMLVTTSPDAVVEGISLCDAYSYCNQLSGSSSLYRDTSVVVVCI